MPPDQHCPGNETFRSMQSFDCKCPHCGAETELFGDEMKKKRTCRACGKEIDPTTCSLYGAGGVNAPR